jgi:hypothetical protein
MIGFRFYVIAILMSLVCSSAYSAPLKIFLANEYEVNQETGTQQPRILNASGEVEIKYFTGGIELHFENLKKQKTMLRLHLDFSNLLDAPIESRRSATEVYDQFRLHGPRVTGSILQQVAQNASAKNGWLVLMLDTHKNPGFFKIDFDLSSARLMSSAGENVRLQNLVAQTFVPPKPVPNSETSEKLGSGSSFSDCELRFTSTR